MGKSWRYIMHPGYAKSPEHYIRAYLMIQKDLLDLFDFVEPADINMKTYSFRIHALFMRACMEFEANCKAILTENDYPKKRPDISDFKKVNNTHGLSSFSIKLPTWRGYEAQRYPFAAWDSGNELKWYRAYNRSKHDRQEEFAEANLGNLIDAVSGLLVLVSAQFHHQDFSNGIGSEMYAFDDETRFQTAIGSYFQIRFPNDWSEEERYAFDHESWISEGAPFGTLKF